MIDNEMYEEDFAMDLMRLTIELNEQTVELNTEIDNAVYITTLIDEAEKMFITNERLTVIASEFTTRGIEVPDWSNRSDLVRIGKVSVSCEGNILSKLKEVILAILSKIGEILKNFVAFNKIHIRTLNKEIKEGVFSNVRAIDITEYEQINKPFFKKDVLTDALKVLNNINYKSEVKATPDFEEAVGDHIANALTSLGWAVNSNSVDKRAVTENDSTLVKLGWKLDDFPVLAADIANLLSSNLQGGRDGLKHYKKILKKLDDVDAAAIIRTKLIHTQRLITIVQEIGIAMSRRTLKIGAEISKSKKK